MSKQKKKVGKEGMHALPDPTKKLSDIEEEIYKFKAGVVVQLKSGGPKMTCTGKNPSLAVGQEGNIVHCKWFAGSKLESGWFPRKSLNIVDESESKKK